MAILRTLRDLFSRGLEATASFLLGRGTKGKAATAAINQRLARTGDTATPQIVGELMRRAAEANMAAALRERLSDAKRVVPPKAPGMDFTNPETGEQSDERTLVIIDYVRDGVHHDIGVVVNHGRGASWDQIKQEAIDRAKIIPDRGVNTPSVKSAIDRGGETITFRSYQNYQRG